MIVLWRVTRHWREKQLAVFGISDIPDELPAS